MPRSASGRIVVEIDPDLKKRLYSALSLDSITLKDWFVKQATDYLSRYPGLTKNTQGFGEGPQSD